MKKSISRKQLIEMGFTTEMIKELHKPKLYPKKTKFGTELIEMWDTRTVRSYLIKKEKNQKLKIRNEKELVEWFQKFLNNMEIYTLSENDLFNTVVSERKEYNDKQAALNNEKVKEINLYDFDFIQRIEVNYIRHNMISYDNFLEIIKSKKNFRKYYPVMKQEILKKIKIAYPYLSYECDLQMQMLNNKYNNNSFQI